MRGTELRDALRALDKVETLEHFRPETVHRGIGAVLPVLGARRLLAATRGDADGAADRRLLSLLAQMEDAAIRLDAIPQRTYKAMERAAVWDEVLAATREVKTKLRQEQDLARIRVAHSA